MYCHKCGFLAAEDAEFCGRCGIKLIKLDGEEINARSNPAAKKKRNKYFIVTGVLGLFLGLIIAAALKEPIQKYAVESGRKGVIEKTRQELLKKGAPIGMFEATWLMSRKEVIKACGDCQQQESGALIQERYAYNNRITGRYLFNHDGLLTAIRISFPRRLFISGSDDDARTIYSEYRNTQNMLSNTYGTMPGPVVRERPEGSEIDVIESIKTIDSVTLRHTLMIWDEQNGRCAYEEIEATYRGRY